MVANRPAINSEDWLRAVYFDPFDPEWSCDTRRKIGTPMYVLH
jgi:hypothetical protein